MLTSPATAWLMAPIIATLNHLLAQAPWSREQLAPHRGKIASIDTGALVLRLRVGADGLCAAAPPDAAAQVTIRVKLSDLPLMLQQPERAFSFVKIEGDADFANAISQLSKSLQWDAEHDLAPLLGQIGAVRVVAGAKAALAGMAQSRQKLAENVAEFLLEEQPVLARASTLEANSTDLTRLRDDVERIGKRIDKLTHKLALKAAL